MIEIRNLSSGEVHLHLAALAQILIDCVEGGASVHFLPPISQTAAESFFSKVIEGIRRGEQILLAAFYDSRLVGTVQIQTAMPPNQPHRAEIAKLLVPRWARRQGIGALLMQQAEEEARQAGKTLLVLDTAAGGDAERLYRNWGWQEAGSIPNFALSANGQLCATTIFWKDIRQCGVEHRECDTKVFGESI